MDNLRLKQAQNLRLKQAQNLRLKQAQNLHDTYTNILAMRSDAQPFIIVYDNIVIFNSNCNIGGAPRPWIEDNDNCTVIFTKDDWDEAIWGADDFEHENLRVQAIIDAMERAGVK